MKLKIVLACSIGLNLVLAAGFWWKNRPASEGGQRVPEVVTHSNATASKAGARAQALTVVAVANQFDWRVVESDDYRKYIANLRGIGCPEPTIRDIIVADVNKLFESRGKGLGYSTNKFQFWKTGNFFADIFDEQKLEKQRQLAAEKRALLKELLGVEVSESAGEMMAALNPMESMLDFLPASKQTELMELEQKYAARLMKSMKDIQKGDLSAMKTIQAEKDAEMLKVLSPQEKEEYDLRMSQTAMMMRMQMSSVELSEQEFRDIFKARKKFEDEFGQLGLAGLGSTSQETRAQRAAAQKELDSQMKGILGEDRYHEYKYDSSFNQSSLKKIAEEHNIPRSSALRVFEIKSVAQEQAQTIRNDKSLTPEQRQTALDATSRETQKAISELIGANAFNAYLEKGSWLKNLNRDRTAPTSE